MRVTSGARVKRSSDFCIGNLAAFVYGPTKLYMLNFPALDCAHAFLEEFSEIFVSGSEKTVIRNHFANGRIE